MSYLSAPRLVFAGQFQADPSTVNNDPEHFNTNRFRSNYQLPGEGASNGWWNPRGTGAFRFRNCSVRSVTYRDGSSCHDPNLDPLVGLPVNGSDLRVEGKIVDLDPEQQMVSQIWGFSVLLGNPEGEFGFRSKFAVTAFGDIWVRFPGGQPDSFFGAFWQSVLERVKWTGALQSRFLEELRENGILPEQLSIKFNVDGFEDDSSSPDFTFGRVVGSIGLYLPEEPRHFVSGRRLWSVPGAPASLNDTPALLDGRILTLDLGNSLPTQSVGGALANVDRLTVAIQPQTGNPVLLGQIDYQCPTWYEQTAGIVSFTLSEEQTQTAGNSPLVVLQNGTQPLLQEAGDGSWVRADDFVFRLNPGDTAATRFYATRFGQPIANGQISLGYDPSIIQGQIKQGPVSGPRIVGQPTSAFTFPAAIPVVNGVAELPIQSADPGNPRHYIDGQLYGVTYGLGDQPPPVGGVQNPSLILSALVWSGFEIPQKPNWLRDLRPIFQQYADLYPIMKPIVDLGNYASLTSRLYILKNVFSAPVTDPNYMPVTRDLSLNKRRMILQWLERPHYMCLDCVEDVCTALQQAIELEHSTLPPYLTALYSIKPGANIEVATTLRSIVIEEMLHMALACNLLISIGGKPDISHPKFVPTYPGGLPGGLRGNLTVRLRKASIAQIRDVFMSIEQPAKTVEAVDHEVDTGNPIETSAFTIGWFYSEIEKALVRLSQQGAISFGHVENQVSGWPGTGRLFQITDLAKARAAIHEIQRQGEGVGPLNPKDGYHELAHYYKFAEIVYGKQLVVKDHDTFAYDGEPIPFDEEGVWPMMDDPNIALYAKGSRAFILSQQFAQLYRNLLNGLHRTFNGDPAYLPQAVGLMYSLDLAARELMQTPSGLNDGTTAGPSFQLPFPE